MCTYAGATIPCTTSSGTWSSTWQCYVSPVTPPPPDGPIWEGHFGQGAIYNCISAAAGGSLLGTGMGQFWAATNPAAPPPPDPRVLAQQAIAQMGLHAITIGITPLNGGKGIIGLPTWMWVSRPSPQTVGPQSRTVTQAGYSVSATATLSDIAWNMGDGTTVTCGVGTPWVASYGAVPSPSCGHTYQAQGTYTVTAISYWVVTWAGIGQTGTINLDFTATQQMVETEVQVVVTGGS